MSHYRDKLLALRESLLQAREGAAGAAQPVELDQARVGRLSRMDAMQAQSMSLETGRRREQQLRRIEAALRRIADGDFGDCQNCGEPIAAARLEADPTALLCIRCAAARER